MLGPPSGSAIRSFEAARLYSRPCRLRRTCLLPESVPVSKSLVRDRAPRRQIGSGTAAASVSGSSVVHFPAYGFIRGKRAAVGSRSGTKRAFIAIRVEGSIPARLPILRVTASATRHQFFAISSELASCSLRSASEYASSLKSRIIASAYASVCSIRARRRSSQDCIFPILFFAIVAI